MCTFAHQLSAVANERLQCNGDVNFNDSVAGAVSVMNLSCCVSVHMCICVCASCMKGIAGSLSQLSNQESKRTHMHTLQTHINMHVYLNAHTHTVLTFCSR